MRSVHGQGYRKNHRRWVYPAAIIAGVFLAGMARAEDIPKDVPVDHWAYKAVQSLVGKGYLEPGHRRRVSRDEGG